MSTSFNKKKRKMINSKREIGQKGFSLVEVIVVLCLMSILSAIAIPSFMKWVPHYRLKSAARDIYSHLQKARIGAIKNNQDWAIVFDAANNRYLLCSGPGADGVWSNTSDNPTEATINLSGYQSGIRYGHGEASTPMGSTFPVDHISYTSNVASFNPDGTGSDGYVYLQNDDNTAYAVGSLTSGVVLLRIWNGSNWQ